MDVTYQDVLVFTRRHLFDIWRSEKSLNSKNLAVFTYVMDISNINAESESENIGFLKAQIANFSSQLSKKWKESQRSASIFESRDREWLNATVEFRLKIEFEEPQPGPSGVDNRGPYKSFENLISVSKKRRLKPLLEKYTQQELSFATETSLRAPGRRDAANLVKEITTQLPKRATNIKKSWKSPKKEPIKYTPEEALSLFIDGAFTKHSYQLMQQGGRTRLANIYPTYAKIISAKKACYPDETAIQITETSAEVRVQALVNHTAQRLVSVQQEVLIQHYEEFGTELTLIYKWGCDGSSGHALYKQKFSGDESDLQTDAFLFAVCIVPLQLKFSESDVVVWHNPKPSSTRFCRPLQILFKKETPELTKTVVQNIEDQIKNINQTVVSINNNDFKIKHVFKMTMINGKTFGVVTDVSTQTCGICGATPKIMNHLEKLKELPPNNTTYEYGISSLHAWIRCLECLLHLTYRLNIKKWQIRGEAEKKIFNTNKTRIQNDFKSKLRLLLDVVKPGYGTTNDGNTASSFFDNPEIAASITGLDQTLIKRFKIILQTISCGYAVNIEAYKKYAVDTAELYIHLYPWFYMPLSVHKLLIHGADIIQAAILPIGMFSEEALEARNKDMRKYREFSSRKFSRLQNITDLFHTLLYSSDPIISALSKENNITRSFKVRSLEDAVKSLLLEPSIGENLDITDDSSSDDFSASD